MKRRAKGREEEGSQTKFLRLSRPSSSSSFHEGLAEHLANADGVFSC